MIEKYIDAISVQLDKYLNIENIYVNEQLQDFETPCFIIHVISSMKNLMLNTRQRRVYPFDIVYMAEDSKDIDTLYTMGDFLYELLDMLEIDEELVRGIDLEYKIVDNALHFFVTYPMLLDYEKTEEKMSSLQQKTEVIING
ncbi:hypothetical protein SAMN05216454_11423 [Peptostreptococcus russellii]|uniref:Uncharacterized protein n=1 Tax=Peptostreptococcus russellii TaxID=215200 RepID=A0A1H8JHD3_9FIRM|nr:hypothetical protein [Peptostreptococcus russellii]SEN80253.1 hypothetical protein SAMN05216454_11423 [Peptostreptococcus russellii]